MLKTISRDIDIEAAIENAYQAELRGDYREGLEILSFFWNFREPQSIPFDEFEKAEFADILLRMGALYGFYGNSKVKSQETSKNILHLAYRLFDENSIADKSASCSNYLAIAYLRMGATSEASFWALNALQYELAVDHPIRLQTHYVQSLIDGANSEYKKSLDGLLKVETLFERTASIYLKACFYNNLAIAQKELNQPHEALRNFALAIKYFSKINNRRYLAYIDNNIAMTFKSLAIFNKAIFHAEKSLKGAIDIDDNRQVGCVYDTLAQIAFDQQKYARATEFSDKAIKILSTIENYGFLVEAYETKVKCLIKQKQTSAALLVSSEALEIARRECSPEIVKGFTDRVSKLLESRSYLKLHQESGYFSTAAEEIELTYPAGFEPPMAVAGVEVMTDRLASFGLKKGCLAVINEDCSIKNGDLVSISVPESGVMLLGVLCFLENMISLEFGTDAIPISFMRNEVQLMGKVIGYCDVLPDGDGKVFVQLIQR